MVLVSQCVTPISTIPTMPTQPQRIIFIQARLMNSRSETRIILVQFRKKGIIPVEKENDMDDLQSRRVITVCRRKG